MSQSTLDTCGIELVKRTATPALFGNYASGGRWKMARHLAYLDERLVEAIVGDQRRIIVTIPPRHGKSVLCSQYLPSWYEGSFPDNRTILTSYEADFAASWGRKARNTLEEHGGVFGVRISKASSAADRWDILGRDGGMMTAGVGGPMTGKGANLLIVDDPIKNAEQAASETYRNKLWDWWQSVAYTRLEPDATVVVIHTRWHEDDLVGRLLADQEQDGGERWTLINLPAIAEDDDLLGRKPGEALWPERFNAERLLQIQRSIGSYFWSALYQQRPAPLSGGIFERGWFEIVPQCPTLNIRACRCWDKAGTQDDGDWSVGVLIVEHGGTFYIADVVREQCTWSKREKIITQTMALDRQRFQRGHVTTVVEREPAASGIESAEGTVRRNPGYDVRIHAPTGDKVLRARALSAQCEISNVKIVSGSWNRAYIDELTSFPNGMHDDQVDASSGAFNFLEPGLLRGGLIPTPSGGKVKVEARNGVRVSSVNAAPRWSGKGK